MFNRVLLKEVYFLCPGGICDLTLLTEEEKKLKEEGCTILTGKVAAANVVNGNNRIYPKKILEREIVKYQKLIDERRSLGSLDHEDTAVINLKEVSHLIKRLWWNGDDVYGVIQLLPTPNGNVAAALAKSNIPLGISTRALGSLKNTPQGDIVEEDLELIAMDLVSNSSAPGAYLSLRENKYFDNQNNVKRNKILKCFDDIFKI